MEKWLGNELSGDLKQDKVFKGSHRRLLSLTLVENTTVVCVAVVNAISL